jgi:cytidine deaminase
MPAFNQTDAGCAAFQGIQRWAFHGMSTDDVDRLCKVAWFARSQARLVHTAGGIRVGCAVLAEADDTGLSSVFAGCNVEHHFRCHDVHAEVNALTNMVVGGHGPATAVLIAAQRDKFTPCGGCLDWIIELSGPDCMVMFQNQPEGTIVTWRARELMPHYPA